MTGATGLAPATSDVPGRKISQLNQQKFRVSAVLAGAARPQSLNSANRASHDRENANRHSPGSGGTRTADIDHIGFLLILPSGAGVYIDVMALRGRLC